MILQGVGCLIDTYKANLWFYATIVTTNPDHFIYCGSVASGEVPTKQKTIDICQLCCDVGLHIKRGNLVQS